MLDIGLVDAGIGTHVSETMAHDQYARFLAQHGVGFVEDELDQTRILVGTQRECPRLLAGLDRCQWHKPSFGFRNYLLRDHENVTVAECEAIVAHRGEDDRGEIVAGADQRDPFEGRNRDLAHEGQSIAFGTRCEGTHSNPLDLHAVQVKRCLRRISRPERIE